METSKWEGSLLDEPPESPVAAEVPSVVAVVVTTDPGERFDEALASLAAQDYPSLTVLVIDAGSRDDPSARIGSLIPGAFIRRIPEPTTFAAAANETLRAVEGANYLLFCTDDVTFAPDAVGQLVEEAVRSNAGVVGPKFVDVERRDVLLQVGLAADKIGVPYSPVEPGEVDHEQHDAVRDVLALPHATLLVRADLWAELRGFTPEFTAGIEELDLCWRARLAGARVIVVPDAVAARPFGSLEERYGSDPDVGRALEPRHRLGMLLRNYGLWSLLRVLPQAAAVSALQALGLLLMGRAGRGSSVVRAWFWNLRHLGETLRRRRSIQALRVVSDADIRSLQIGGISYLRAFLAGRLHLGQRVDELSGSGRAFVEGVTLGIRSPATVFTVSLLAVVALGSRDLVTDRVPAVGSLLHWPGMSELWREFTSAWRHAGSGAGLPASPALALMAGLSAVFLGNADVARTALVVLAIPVGAWGMHRLMRPLARAWWAPVGAAFVYAVVPVPRNIIASGRIGPLVFYAAAPYMLERVLRSSGLAPYGTLEDDAEPNAAQEPGPERDRRRAMLSLAMILAVVAAFFPPALLYVPVMAAALVGASALVRGRVASLRGLVAALAAAGVALVLLFPWSLSLVLPTPDLDALGFAFRPRPGLFRVLAFDTGPAAVGLTWLLPAAALHPVLVGSGFRLRWAGRAWTLAVVGWVAAWLPGQLDLPGGTPPAEASLVVAALGIAMAVGLGAGVLGEELRRAAMTWRQLVSVTAVAALTLAALPFLGDSVDGRWHLPARDWQQTLGWMASERAHGGFRVLWVGDPTVLPGDPATLPDGTAWVMSRDGTGDARGLYPPPATGASEHVDAAVRAAVDGRTDRLGHLLAPLAVRYVAYPLRSRPGVVVSDVTRETPLSAGLSRQIDLEEQQGVDPALILYENEAWIPSGALVTGEAARTAATASRLGAIRIDTGGNVRPVPGIAGNPRDVTLPPGSADDVAGLLVVAEPYGRGWEATAGGALRPHSRAFGLVNGFEVEDVDRVRVSHGGQFLRYGSLGVGVVLWLLVVSAWRSRGERERFRLYAHRQAVRDVRPTGRVP